MADTMVLHNITWLYSLVYAANDQSAAYDDFSVPLFVSGYYTVMEQEKNSIKPVLTNHLQEHMTNMELYGLEVVRLYHAVCVKAPAAFSLAGLTHTRRPQAGGHGEPRIVPATFMQHTKPQAGFS